MKSLLKGAPRPDLALGPASARAGPDALDWFLVACDQPGMKIITEKTEVLCISRNKMQCTLQVSGSALLQVKFKYLGIQERRKAEQGY